MFKLLLETSIFMPLGKLDGQNKKAYYQLSGEFDLFYYVLPMLSSSWVLGYVPEH
jgi:hypothetical protein